jgi:hypothetical protein
MPTYYARKAGNINAADVWATAPAGTASAVTFADGDVLMANSFAITVNVSTNLGATGEVRNDTFGGATAGGSFTLSNGVTLTANCFANQTFLVTFSGTAGNSASIVGNCTGGGGGGGATGATAARNTSTGTLNITGNCTGGSGATAANNASTGTLNITGNCTGGGGGTGVVGANNASTGTLNITGNCTGGSGGTGVVGANNASTGTMLINGVIQASEFNAGVGGPSAQQVTLLTGPFLISPTFGVNPIANVAWRWASALNNHTYIEVGTQTLLEKRNLVTPDNATNFPAASDVRSGTPYGIGGVVFGTCAVPSPAAVAMGTPVDDTVGTLTISVPTASEIATAVWGASTKTITGGVVDTLTTAPTVPTPSQIASQVRTELSTELSRLDVATSTRAVAADIPTSDISAIKAKTDSLPASPAAVSDIPTADIAAIKASTDNLPSDPADQSLVEAAISALSIPSVADIRTELDANSTKLANLDASVSSRLASSAYTAPSTPPTAGDIASAVWAAADKTGYSLTSAERSAIAAAVESSILNEGDGQAVLNALVAAIGNSNVDQIALVAAIRADLERTGGKLINLDATISSRLASADYNAPTSAPTAASVANAVWSAATRTTTGGTVDTLTNAPASVTPADIWDYNARTLTSASGPTAIEIRQELDSNSTQLSGIKAKTDALPSDPADQSLLEAAIAGVTAPSASTVAAAVRSELSVELARVDQAVSSRLAASEASKLDAVKAKTDLLQTDRLAQCSTVATTGAQLAAALS